MANKRLVTWEDGKIIADTTFEVPDEQVAKEQAGSAMKEAHTIIDNMKDLSDVRNFLKILVDRDN